MPLLSRLEGTIMQTTTNVSDSLQEEPHTPAPENAPTTEAPSVQQAEGTLTAAVVPLKEEVIDGEVTAILEPEHKPTPKQPPYYLIVVVTIAGCLLFTLVSFMLPLLRPSATVTILPVERTITTLDAIQVQGRSLPPLTLMQSTSVSATGHRHQNATNAYGTITFYNGLLTSQTIAAGTIFTGNDGVQIITDQAAIVPAGNPPIYGQVTVSAHAALAGEQGNIPAYDINTACCATSVVAKNTQDFTGGQAARDFLIVTRTDINTAVTSLLVLLSQSENAALQAQLQPNEQLIIPSCTPRVSSDHTPGDEAKHVSVTVSETCTGIGYDAHQVYANATQLITSQTGSTLGANYALVGDIQVTIVHATITNSHQGLAHIIVQVRGTWVYQITPPIEQHLVQLIAGKTKQQAITILLHFPGIQAASIQLARGNTSLPSDPNHIHLIVMYQTS